MLVPDYVKEADRLAMNEAARDMAWKWRGIGIMNAIEALRDGLADGYTPTRDELIALCNLLEEETRKPRTDQPTLE